MKTKKIQKKLELNKQTIATLGREEMSDVKAGCFTPFTPLTPVITIILHCNKDTVGCAGKVETIVGPYC
ncbi:MAG: class I lanthipeptide [Candidatus Aminicenantes bacterium]|nr:class I lanthipeptide [Candidatus Aminicenantes bacterium]